MLFGVRLKPGVAYLLTGVPAHKLIDCRTRLAALLAEDALRLEDRLARSQTVDEGLDVLEAFLLHRLVGVRIDSRIQEALKRIEDCGGKIRIAQLARECRVSPRHLDRLLCNWVGFPPKRLARLVRFQSLLQRMETAPSFGLAGVAPELGYFDQAHLVNEVARLAGVSPRHIAPHGVADFSKTRCE